jgi:two-component system, NarL family, nitrate/nitrite response regulator NarL
MSAVTDFVVLHDEPGAGILEAHAEDCEILGDAGPEWMKKDVCVIRILIVTDIRLYREGLAQMLGRSEHLEVVGAVARGDEALASIASGAPDIVLLDLGIPDGVAVIGAIRNAAPHVGVVVLAVAEVEGDVLACAEAGATGYVPRDASVEELTAVLQSVGRGEALCSPRITATLFRRVAALTARLGSQSTLIQLTTREREVIRLIDRGLSNKEIARTIGVEVATVKNHVHNILEKLHVHRRGEAAARMRGPFHTQLRQGAL